MIYVPDLENYKCFVVRSDTTIRAYKEKPRNNMTIEYRDYYYNSNYLYQDSEQSFSSYGVLPVCLDNSVLTSEVYYRNDFDRILIIFIILCIVVVVCPLKIFLRFFRRLR